MSNQTPPLVKPSRSSAFNEPAPSMPVDSSEAKPHIFFLVNPKASSGAAGKKWRKMETHLMPAFPKAQVLYTRHRGHAKEIVLAELNNNSGWIPSSRNPAVFVAVGGDGILHDVVNGVMQSNLSGNSHIYLFNIPLGNTNNFYKSLYGSCKHEFTCDAFVQSINELQSVPVNIVKGTATNPVGSGTQNGTNPFYFVNVTSMGITGEVVHELTRNPQHCHSGLKYRWKLWTKTFFGGSNKRSFPVTVRVEGSQSVTYNAFMIAVCNGERFGNGLKLAPGASPIDNKLEVIAVHDASIMYLLGRYLRRLWKGKLTTDPEHVARVETDKPITVEAVLPQHQVFLEADGESVGVLPASFHIDKNLKFLTIHGAPGVSQSAK